MLGYDGRLGNFVEHWMPSLPFPDYDKGGQCILRSD